MIQKDLAEMQGTWVQLKEARLECVVACFSFMLSLMGARVRRATIEKGLTPVLPVKDGSTCWLSGVMASSTSALMTNVSRKRICFGRC